jgi:polyhydroxyalkanoate synthesis regulator phasin
MASKQVKMFNDWINAAQERVKSASVKVAADQEALNMKDPTERGQVSIPDCGDGSNRAAQGLPTNTSNMGEPNKEHNIFDVTKPNGAGQGEYVVPKDGTAADEAVKSPTTPLSKMAQALKELQQKSAGATATTTVPATPAPATPAPAAPVKQASQGTFELPISLLPDNSLMDKLASIGGIMLGSEAGQQMVAEVLEKEAGIAEARAIIAEAQATMEKEAASQFHTEHNMSNNINTGMYKLAAAAQSAHVAWYNSFNTDMEKHAYMNGAEDGAAVADAMEAGEDPEALADVSDEEVLAYLQELVESGQISQEEAEAVLQAVGDAGEDGLTPEEMAQALTEAVESGEITPEHAQALAQQYMAEFGGAGAEGAEDPAAAEAAAMEDPAVQEAAAAATEKTASVINRLWTPNMA